MSGIQIVIRDKVIAKVDFDVDDEAALLVLERFVRHLGLEGLADLLVRWKYDAMRGAREVQAGELRAAMVGQIDDVVAEENKL